VLAIMSEDGSRVAIMAYPLLRDGMPLPCDDIEIRRPLPTRKG